MKKLKELQMYNNNSTNDAKSTDDATKSNAMQSQQRVQQITSYDGS